MLVSWNEYGNDRFLVKLFPLKNTDLRTSLVVWWLRFHTSSAGGTGLIPGLGTEISYAVWHGQEKKVQILKANNLELIHKTNGRQPIEWEKIIANAAAVSLQSCPTLCDPIDGNAPGCSVPGILQARILEWVAISFSNACMHAKSLQLCPTLCDPVDSSPPGSSVHRIL